jgi:hypothetical protein
VQEFALFVTIFKLIKIKILAIFTQKCDKDKIQANHFAQLI